MNEKRPLLSSFIVGEMRLYFVAIALFLIGLFIFNLITLRPSLSPTRVLLYALFTLLLIVEYAYVFTLLFPRGLRFMLLWLSLEGMLVYGVIQVLGQRATPYVFLLMFDSYAAAVVTRRWLALLIVTVLTAIVGLNYGILWGWREGALALRSELFWIGLAVLSSEVFVRQWRQREHVERLLAELEQAHRQLRRYAEQAEELAVTRERARLAHELHDTVGHILTALDVQLELLVRLPPGQTEQRRQVALQARALVKEGLADVRRAVQALRPLALESFSLPEAIARLVSDFEKAAQIPVVRETDDDLITLSPALAMPLYRAVQESLTNIQRHAPDATHVTLHLHRASDTVTLTVENDGISAAFLPRPDGEPGTGYGLRGLQERAEALGGTFHAGPDPQNDLFRVVMTLPLQDNL